MRLEIGVRIERDQVHCSDLRILHVADHLPGQVVILEPAVTEPDHLAGNVALEVAPQVEIHRTDRRKDDTPDDDPLDSIIEKPFLHPTPIAEFLRHHAPVVRSGRFGCPSHRRRRARAECPDDHRQ